VLGDPAPVKEEVAEQTEAVSTMAPVLVEDAQAPQIVETITAHDEDAEPEFITLQTPAQDSNPSSIVFDEKKEEPKPAPVAEELQFSLHVKPVEETVSVKDAVATHEALVKKIDGLLEKPSQIYATAPAQPKVEEATEKPLYIQEPLVAKQEDDTTKQESIAAKVVPATSTNRFDADYTQPQTPVKKAEAPKEKKLIQEEEESFDFGLVIKTEAPTTDKKPAVAVENYPAAELSEEEEQKRRAQERVDKIRKLRNLSFNFNSVDAGSEFEQVPAYLRRDTDLHNSIANVENFYSRAQVKKDDKSGSSISTINTFLDGSNPD
jgi:cell division protein FtsZ